MLELAESGQLFKSYDFSFRIWPCTNPTGFEQGTRNSVDGVDINRTFGRGGQSPEARAITTANRDRRFILSLDLHEDFDATGFYCYDYDRDALQRGRATFGDAVVRTLEAEEFPIQAFDDDYDLGSPLPAESVRFERGLVHADPIAEAAAIGGLSYSLAMARRAARYALTFETPTSLAWQTRLAMHRTAILAALDALRQRLPS